MNRRLKTTLSSKPDSVLLEALRMQAKQISKLCPGATVKSYGTFKTYESERAMYKDIVGHDTVVLTG